MDNRNRVPLERGEDGTERKGCHFKDASWESGPRWMERRPIQAKDYDAYSVKYWSNHQEGRLQGGVHLCHLQWGQPDHERCNWRLVWNHRKPANTRQHKSINKISNSLFQINYNRKYFEFKKNIYSRNFQILDLEAMIEDIKKKVLLDVFLIKFLNFASKVYLTKIYINL